MGYQAKVKEHRRLLRWMLPGTFDRWMALHGGYLRTRTALRWGRTPLLCSLDPSGYNRRERRHPSPERLLREAERRLRDT